MKERKSSGICSIFYNETNLIEKKLIISVSLMYSLMISGIIGMAFWFKDPIFLCKSESNENYYECSHDDACSSDFPFKIDSINGPDTLAVKLNLFCDRRFIKRFLLSFVFFGGFLGCLTNIIKYIGPNQRKKVFGLLGFIFAISHFSITLFSHNVSVVAISLIMISFSVMIGNAYSFMLINEFFTGDVAKVSIVLMSISCGTGGILYVVFSYLVNSNSMLLFLIMGILVFFNSFYLFFFKGPDNFKEAMSKNPTGTLQFIKEISEIPVIKRNFIIFLFLWTSTSITYNDLLIEIGSVGGNLYFNLVLVSFAEICASFSAGILSLKYNTGKCLKATSFCLCVLFSMFFFVPTNLSTLKNSVFAKIFIIILFIGKLLSEMTCNLIYLYAPKVLSEKFTPFFMMSLRLFSRIFLLFLPHINFIFASVHLHSFLFLAIIWGMGRFFLLFAKEVTESGIEELLNEFNVGMAGRMSIMSNGLHLNHGPDEFLKNINIGHHSLSVIRKSRTNVEMDNLRRAKSAFVRDKDFEIDKFLDKNDKLDIEKRLLE